MYFHVPSIQGAGAESDTDSKWTDSETELETPRNKRTESPTKPTPDHISEEGSQLSEEEAEATGTKLKSAQATPTPTQSVKRQDSTHIKSDSESAWSDNDSPRKNDPISEPTVKANLSIKPDLKKQSPILSDSESAWSDNETPRLPTQPVQSNNQVKSDDESVWSDTGETPRAAEKTPTAEAVTRQQRIKSESESAWSDDEPDAAKQSQLTKPVESDDDSSPRKSPPAASVVSAAVTKPHDMMRQQSADSVWSDDEDDIEAMAAPAVSKPLAVSAQDTVKTDMTRQQSVESAWSVEAEDEEPINVSTHPLTSTYERNPLNSTYDIGEVAQEEIIPSPASTLKAPPPSRNTTMRNTALPSVDKGDEEEESDWSEADDEDLSPNQTPGNVTSNVTGVLGLDEESDLDNSDSLPLSTNKSNDNKVRFLSCHMPIQFQFYERL